MLEDAAADAVGREAEELGEIGVGRRRAEALDPIDQPARADEPAEAQAARGLDRDHGRPGGRNQRMPPRLRLRREQLETRQRDHARGHVLRVQLFGGVAGERHLGSARHQHHVRVAGSRTA